MGELSDLLPDFDDMDRMAKIISDAKANLEDTKNLLDQKVASCIQAAITDDRYWINNKPPSMAYCTSVVAYTGNTPEDRKELNALRSKLSELMKKFQEAKQLLHNMESRISVWQTHSANKRKVLG